MTATVCQILFLLCDLHNISTEQTELYNIVYYTAVYNTAAHYTAVNYDNRCSEMLEHILVQYVAQVAQELNQQPM